MTVQDLRFSLDFQAAQLLLQTGHGARQLAEVEVERAELLLQARARDAGLAGDVEQLVEQLGVDSRHFLALGRRDRLASRRHWLRRQQILSSGLSGLRLPRPRRDGDGAGQCVIAGGS